MGTMSDKGSYPNDIPLFFPEAPGALPHPADQEVAGRTLCAHEEPSELGPAAPQEPVVPDWDQLGPRSLAEGRQSVPLPSDLEERVRWQEVATGVNVHLRRAELHRLLVPRRRVFPE